MLWRGMVPRRAGEVELLQRAGASAPVAMHALLVDRGVLPVGSTRRGRREREEFHTRWREAERRRRVLAVLADVHASQLPPSETGRVLRSLLAAYTDISQCGKQLTALRATAPKHSGQDRLYLLDECCLALQTMRL